MAGTIIERPRTKRGEYVFQARIPIPGRPGMRKEKRFSDDNKRRAERAAERWLARERDLILLGKSGDPTTERMTFRDLADEWRAGWTNQKPSTRQDYESILAKHLLPKFGDTRVSAMKPNDVQRYIGELRKAGKSPRTVRKIVGVLSNALNTAVRREIIPVNPIGGGRLDLPSARDRKRPVVIFEDDLRTLVEAMPEEWRLYVQIGALTGMRAGEVCALRRGDVDFNAEVLRVDGSITEIRSKRLPEGERGLNRNTTKNGFARVSMLPSPLRKPLAEHLLRMQDGRPDALLFTWHDGGPVHHNTFLKTVFKPTVRKLWPAPDPRAGLTYHGLRHSAASVLARRGVPMAATQKQLGHLTSAMTNEVYTHAAPDALEVVAAAMEAAWELEGATARAEG